MKLWQLDRLVVRSLGHCVASAHPGICYGSREGGVSFENQAGTLDYLLVDDLPLLGVRRGNNRRWCWLDS